MNSVRLTAPWSAVCGLQVSATKGSGQKAERWRLEIILDLDGLHMTMSLLSSASIRFLKSCILGIIAMGVDLHFYRTSATVIMIHEGLTTSLEVLNPHLEMRLLYGLLESLHSSFECKESSSRWTAMR